MAVKHARRRSGALTAKQIALVLVLLLILFLLLLFLGRKWICLYCPKPKIFVSQALPAGCPANAPPSDTTQLRACIGGLVFDTVPAIGDEQRLMVRSTGPGPFCHGDSTHSCRYGPLSKIEPVMGAHEYSDSALNEGRIIARLFIQPGETEEYPKLGMALNDTTYWWVNTATDASVFLRKGSGAGLEDTSYVLQVDSHPGRFDQAVARWIWDDTDEKSQGTCGQACCR